MKCTCPEPSALTAVAQDYLKVIWSAQEWSDAPVTTKMLAERIGVRQLNAPMFAAHPLPSVLAYPLPEDIVGTPDFSGAGNLWNWLPQLRVTRELGAAEHFVDCIVTANIRHHVQQTLPVRECGGVHATVGILRVACREQLTKKRMGYSRTRHCAGPCTAEERTVARRIMHQSTAVLTDMAVQLADAHHATIRHLHTYADHGRGIDDLE